MSMKALKLSALFLVVVCVLSTSAFGQRAFQFREDYEMEPLSDCALQYYYYIPCPTYSWFWSFYYWYTGDVAGAWFDIGDMSTGGFEACDPTECHMLDQFRILNTGVVCQGPMGET